MQGTARTALTVALLLQGLASEAEGGREGSRSLLAGVCLRLLEGPPRSPGLWVYTVAMQPQRF